ncbi:MAG TPA: hypothetical protein VM869_04870, partial [Enhygromyxa sp.]|nr:hypothetical protein [Enhygromyxa sp.]
MHARSSTLISATVLFAIACTGGEKSEPVAKNDPEVASKTDPGPAPEAKNDPAGASDPQPEGEAKPDGEAKPEPPKPAVPVVPVEPGVVPITAVAPVAATASWREVATVDGSLQFANLTGGVVGKSDAGYWDMSDTGQLVMRPEIEAPGAEMFGIWPSDVWFIESRTKEFEDDRSGETITELRLMRLRSNHRWVPQDYDGEQRFVDEGHQIRKGWKGGLLVSTGLAIHTRVAGGADDIQLTVDNGRIFDFFETRSGRIYVITEKDAALWAQQDCGAEGCETPPAAVKLPYGTDWEFAMQIPRQRGEAVALAIATVEGLGKHHILHYET